MSPSSPNRTKPAVLSALRPPGAAFGPAGRARAAVWVPRSTSSAATSLPEITTWVKVTTRSGNAFLVVAKVRTTASRPTDVRSPIRASTSGASMAAYSSSPSALHALSKDLTSSATGTADDDCVEPMTPPGRFLGPGDAKGPHPSRHHAAEGGGGG